jgi:hypothetical protein
VAAPAVAPQLLEQGQAEFISLLSGVQKMDDEAPLKIAVKSSMDRSLGYTQ